MTTSNQRYLVAKYVEDVSRMEPKNIGVVLWAAKRVKARFLPPESVSFIKDKKMYQRWTTFWKEAASDQSRRMKDGTEVTPAEPRYLDALLETQRGNFLLFDSGFIADKIKVGEVESAADFLFQKLVLRDKATDTQSPVDAPVRMDRMCKKIFADAGLAEREDFKTTKPVPCAMGKVVREFRPHYALFPNETPLAVWHRVDVSQVRDIDSTAFMFEQLIAKSVVSGRARCGALVHGNLGENQVSGAIETLSEYSTVINVDDPLTAVRRAEAVAFGPLTLG